MPNNTASPLEIFAFATNICGMIILGHLMRSTYLQYTSSVERFIGARVQLYVIAANRNFRCELSRMSYHVFLIILDVWLMFLPDRDTGFYHTLTWGLLIISSGMAFISYLDLRSERRMTELLQ